MLALRLFEKAWERCNQLAAIHEYLSGSQTAVVPLDEILRAEWVARVSTIDLYFKELIAEKVREIYLGNLPETDEYLNVKLSFYRLNQIHIHLTDRTVEDPVVTRILVANHIDGAIREFLQTKTLQKPDKITECLKYCSSIRIWEELVKNENLKISYPTANSLRDQLNSIVERRNQIVHQSDLAVTGIASINDDLEKRSPTKISKQDLQIVREFIETFIRGVDLIINNHSA